MRKIIGWSILFILAIGLCAVVYYQVGGERLAIFIFSVAILAVFFLAFHLIIDIDE